MATITIDGVGLPEPTSLKLPEFDLDSESTGRNELGVLQRDRIRQGVLKCELEWKKVTTAQLTLIKNAIIPDKFTVSFPAGLEIGEKEMYAGDRTIELVTYKDSDANKLLWNISFNLTEY